MFLLYTQYKTSLKDQSPVAEIAKYSPNIKINLRKKTHTCTKIHKNVNSRLLHLRRKSSS